MDPIDKAILTRLSTSFPLTPRPFATLGRELGLTEAEALARVRDLKERGIIRRIGGTINPRRINWYSTLCAASLPEHKLPEYARIVNAYREVTHNYVRTGQPNCWFTLIAPGKTRAEEIIRAIQSALAVPIQELHATRVFKIDVGFSLADDSASAS